MALPPGRFTYEANQLGAPVTINVNGQDIEVTKEFQCLQPTTYISAIEAPFIMMSYAEVELWMAEAAFRGWTTGGTASEHFAKALAAGVNQMTVYGAPAVEQTVIDDFVADNPLSFRRRVGADQQRALGELCVEWTRSVCELEKDWPPCSCVSQSLPQRERI